MPGDMIETGRCTQASGAEFNRFLASGDLAELTLGPFGTQRNRLVT